MAAAATTPVATGVVALPAGSAYFGVNPARILDTPDGTGTGGRVAQLGPAGAMDHTVAGGAGCRHQA